MAKRNKKGANPIDLFQENIKNEINIMLRRDIADPRLNLVTITRVDLNRDYSQAKVYWDTYDADKRGDIKKALDAGFVKRMRSLLAKTLNVRHTPELYFFYDSQFEDEFKISELIKDASKSSSCDDEDL